MLFYVPLIAYKTNNKDSNFQAFKAQFRYLQSAKRIGSEFLTFKILISELQRNYL